ncbi:MAG: tyrosine-type recombinase/integrase [Ruminococcus sp.]|nr:tyrosine-type recombinase/integrase [Ruminococcus sp.]
MFEYKLYTADFLNYCQYHKNLSTKTIQAYKIDLRQYEAFSEDLTKTALWDYIGFLNMQYKPKTVKRKIATLKSFSHYLLIHDLIECNPFDKIETTIKEPLLLPKTIPLNIVNQIISHLYLQIDQATTEYQLKCAVRNVAVIELLFATGARIAEICTLKVNDVDLQGNSIKFFGKGAKERIIPIENLEVVTILKKYYMLHEQDISNCEMFFVNKLKRRLTEQSVRNMLQRCCEECNISIHITPHMFRHSFATFLLEEDVDIRYIQRMLGHSSITTTQIYTHVTSSKQKEILKNKHPRNKLKI